MIKKVKTRVQNKLTILLKFMIEGIWLKKLYLSLDRASGLKLSDAAAAMSYYIALSIFPFFIFMMMILALVSKAWNDPDAIYYLRSAIYYFSNLIPDQVLEFLKPLIRDVVRNYRISLLSIGALSLLWSSSQGFDTFSNNLLAIYQRPSIPFWRSRLLGIVYSFAMTLILIILLALLAFGDVILGFIKNIMKIEVFNAELIELIRLGIPFIIVGIMMSLIYFFMAGRKGGYLLAALASILPTLGWMLLSISLSWFINKFTRYDLIYGSITGLILLLLWLYILFWLVFWGAFIHSELIIKMNE